MNRAVILCLLLSCFCLAELRGAQFYYLPQVANGAFPDGSMRTTFVLFNPTATPATATIRLTDDLGQAMEVTIPGLGTDVTFGPISLGAGHSRVLQTDGTGALRAGAAHVEASSPIAVSAIFSLYDTTGTLLTEGGVGASSPQTDFVVPVDTTEPFNTGIALFNSSDQETTANILLIGPDGAQVDATSVHLLHFGHLARFVAGQDGLFPAMTGFRGSLRVHATQTVAAVTLRQNANPISNTTLPVVPVYGSGTQFNLPQVANGLMSGSSISMRTTFVILNPSANPARVTVTLRKQDGTPLPITVPGGIADNSSSFTRLVPPSGSAFLQTDGSGALQVGSALVASDVPVGVSGIFTVFSGTSFATEAGVGDSPARLTLTVPVDIRPGANTGVALFNPSSSPASVTISLYSAEGQKVIDAQPLVLNGNGQTAKLVPELLAVSTTFLGTMAVTATQPVAAVTLRQNEAPLSYTTLPVGEGTAVAP